MVTQKLIKFIKTAKKNGKPDAKIRSALTEAGWKEEDINKGFQAAKSERNKEKKETTKSSSLVLLQKILIGIIIFLVLIEGIIIASVLIWDRKTLKNWINSNIIETISFK
jgi:hypothetical protein